MEPIPSIDAAPPGLFDGGHLWLHELVTGPWITFRMTDTGTIEFTAVDGTAIDDDVPLAVRYVRTRFERDALFAAVEDVTMYRFLGLAPTFGGLEYEWDRLAPFLGFEIWPRGAERSLAPDDVEKIYQELGLEPLPTTEREVRALDYRPNRDPMPRSNWCAESVYGLVIRNKTGDRATVVRTDVTEPNPIDPTSWSPDEWGRRFVTTDRIERAAAILRGSGTPVTVDGIRELLVAIIARETALDPVLPADPELARRYRTAAVERIAPWIESS